MRSDIAPGGAFPDYELPDHMGAVRKLSELQGEDPLILMLARGQYCPKEHQQHLELAAFYPKIRPRFNAIAPGVVNTSMHADDSKDDLKSQSPMGEISEIQDIVDAVIYLTGAPCYRRGAARGHRGAHGEVVAGDVRLLEQGRET